MHSKMQIWSANEFTIKGQALQGLKSFPLLAYNLKPVKFRKSDTDSLIKSNLGLFSALYVKWASALRNLRARDCVSVCV